MGYGGPEKQAMTQKKVQGDVILSNQITVALKIA